jgi:hypothetical protein
MVATIVIKAFKQHLWCSRTQSLMAQGTVEWTKQNGLREKFAGIVSARKGAEPVGSLPSRFIGTNIF